MGSATREALTQSVEALSDVEGVDLAASADLLSACDVIAGSPQLQAALSDPSGSAETKRSVVDQLFAGRVSSTAVSILTDVVQRRWSNETDMIAGIEDLGIRSAAVAEPDAQIESELFQFGRIVRANAELELALGARLAPADQKVAVVRSLLGGKASEATVLVVAHLVAHPRGRRVGQLLSEAAEIVADQRGRTIATVTSARELSSSQVDTLRTMLGEMYGRDITFNLVVDPDVVGGMRVQAGNDVIDASIAARLDDLKLKLAG